MIVISIIVAAVVLLNLVFLVLMTLAARFETRMVWPYGELRDLPPYDEEAPQALDVADKAQQAGYEFIGWCSHLPEKRYRINYAFLISGDRRSLMIIGSGKMYSMPIRGIMLYTRTADEKVINTGNTHMVFDLSRTWRGQLVLDTDPAEIVRRHADILVSRAIETRPFTDGCEIDDMRTLRTTQAARMAELGWIRYTGSERTSWRYTLYGAVCVAVANTCINMLRGSTKGRYPALV